MWFLVRATFWLGLVYSQLDWRDASPAVDVARIARSATSAASQGAARLCAEDPRRCVGRARRLEGLLPAKSAAGAREPG